MNIQTLAKIENRFRPFIAKLPPKLVTSIYSKGRLFFLKKLCKQIPKTNYSPPPKFARTLWGIKFRSPLMNAAGIYKNGDGYELSLHQGAGAFLGGTTTWNSREGNTKAGIHLPFVPYPRSASASNFLGLPNEGDEINSKKIIDFKKVEGFPIGWSLIASPDLQGQEKLQFLVKGMKLYENAGIDFLEINESCPNTEDSHANQEFEQLKVRLTYIKENFLTKRSRKLPVIVKFSCDVQLSQLPQILNLLFSLGYDGINLGNSSTNYSAIKSKIHKSEVKLFDFFTQNFKGGLSGLPLKKMSLKLANAAVEYVKNNKPSQEFHVIRTGGIESYADLEQSEKAGITLNQWFTGYFENFGHHGHDLYKNLLEKGI